MAVAEEFSSPQEGAGPIAFDCQTCGACCAYSSRWPRFSTEDDAQLDLIPQKYVAADEAGMRCDGARCSALCGEVGKSTACGIYDIRPDVCRACMPGDDDCLIARRAHGLPTLE
ncbi:MULTISPECIES: YkgJ family cysteine cluster protein [unclassified Mesorhizobium]|uniref:YkgJ family cysteine cluster protein n=2 Tax=unclassified Mesorhizobium TaxID=325217 RepID=UPI00333A96B1